MSRLNDRFAAWIRERPDQWLCIKRRWPKECRRTAEPAPLIDPRRAAIDPGVALDGSTTRRRKTG